MNDPGSLQNLNDIVMPAPVGWWPLAPGWYVAAAIASLALAWLSVKAWRRRQRNRHRREALRWLAQLRASGGGRARELPELLKRAALSAWPRNEVASLSGESWHRFLDRTADLSAFDGAAGRTLDRLAYGQATVPSSDELEALYLASERWLRRHRVAETRG